MSSDTKWVVGSIIGTGGVIAALLLTLVGLMFQQNANVNARINDVQSDIQDIRADIRELRALVIDALKGDDPAD